MDLLISQLGKIRNALGYDVEHPGIRSSRDIRPQRVGNDPIFDTRGWDISNQRRWQDIKEGARRAIEGEGRSSGQSGSGIEALAWYVSFHNNQRDWGIYIPLSSLALLDELYFDNLSIERDKRIQLGWSALLAHEQLHFAIDHACAWFELMLRAPIRREFVARLNSKPPVSIAEAEVSETYLEVEETAANAHMIRYIRRTQPRQIAT
jgi:hypothetical protein